MFFFFLTTWFCGHSVTPLLFMWGLLLFFSLPSLNMFSSYKSLDCKKKSNLKFTFGRLCVLLGQVLHRIRHFKGGFLEQESISCLFVCPFTPHTTAQQHQGHEEDQLKCSWAWGRTPPGNYPLLGVTISIGYPWGPLKQTKFTWKLSFNTINL